MSEVLQVEAASAPPPEQPAAPPQPRRLPNVLPTAPHPRGRRIALIGGAPDHQAMLTGIPLVSESAKSLWGFLQRCGVTREQLLVGHVSQQQPPGNELQWFKWDGPQLTEGRAALRTDLEAFQPHLCILMGATPLRAFLGHPGAIQAWRGSLFRSTELTTTPVTCLATYHPDDVVVDMRLGALMRADLRRALAEAELDTLLLPQRTLRTFNDNEPANEVLDLLALMHQEPRVSVDIEGHVWRVTHFGWSWGDGSHAASIPFYRDDKSERWSAEDAAALWTAICGLLQSPTVEKVGHNLLYDAFALRYGKHCTLQGALHDTMMQWWELYAEQDKDLNTVAATLTREPCWNVALSTAPSSSISRYNAIDCAVTLEAHLRLNEQLTGSSLAHYHFSRSLIPAFLHMSVRGIRYDHEEAARQRIGVVAELFAKQDELDRLAGKPMPSLELLRTHCCNKTQLRMLTRSGDPITLEQCAAVVNQTKRDTWTRGLELLPLVPTSPEARGELAQLLECSLNINSSKQVQHYLINELKLPPILDRTTKRATLNATALLKMRKRRNHPALDLLLKLRSLDTEAETLGKRCDPDGRIRSAYNICATDTGRCAAYESPTGTGYNLQTVTKRHKPLFLADPGCLVAQLDLSGADSWTVAAHCAALGDRTMLEDLLAGLKPAKVLLLLRDHGQVINTLDRQELAVRLLECPVDKQLYEVSKSVNHGTCYGLKPDGMVDNLISKSYKQTGTPLFVESAACKELQRLYLSRYPGVEQWHKQSERQLCEVGFLVAASGAKRVFFGRKKERSYSGDLRVCGQTWRAWLANEPQANTTYATLLGLQRLWSDSENWTQPTAEEPAKLIVEPLHTVHDSLWVQFAEERKEWALAKIAQWMDNTLTIAGMPIRIPYELGVGRSFGELEEP